MKLYRAMVLTRTFDAKAIALQRTGRLGTYASSLGQEAVAVGVAAAMQADDVLLPSFREHGAQIWRGVTLKELFLYWGGDERGNDFAGPREDFPNLRAGRNACPARGRAWRSPSACGSEKRAAVCVFGDGATSKGDVGGSAEHGRRLEGCRLVFVVNNNGWAISVPVAKQTAAADAGAEGHGRRHSGRAVDGNDVIAVRQATADALARRAAATARLDRGGHLPPVRSHDGRRCRPLSQRCRGQPPLAGRAGRPIAHLPRRRIGAWGREQEDGLSRDAARRWNAAAADYLADAAAAGSRRCSIEPTRRCPPTLRSSARTRPAMPQVMP